MGSIETVSLPSSDSSELILTPASPSERIQCFQINGHSWAGVLSPTQYLGREDHLYQQDLTKNGRQTYWILTTQEQPDQRPILSACETILKAGWVARGGSGKVEEVQCHGIGSVFCRPEYRGRGYAGRMMQELGKQLDNGWQQPNGTKPAFSVLWSDIGHKFYQSFGWQLQSSRHISLDPISESSFNAVFERLSLPTTQDLSASDLSSTICPQDVKQSYQQMLQLSSSAKSSTKTFVSIVPDYDHISWHHSREEYQNTVDGKAAPAVKGVTVALSSSPSAINPSLIWTRTYGSSPKHFILMGLRLILPPSSQQENTEDLVNAIASLLLRAQLEASKWNMTQFELWSPNELIIAAAKKLKNVEKDVDIVVVREKESLPMIRWSGDTEASGTIEFVNNEKYGWC